MRIFGEDIRITPCNERIQQLRHEADWNGDASPSSVLQAQQANSDCRRESKVSSAKLQDEEN